MRGERHPVRLDRVVNPYGLPVAAREGPFPLLAAEPGDARRRLGERLSQVFRVRPESIEVVTSTDEGLRRAVAQSSGQLVICPPTTLLPSLPKSHGVIRLNRGIGADSALDPSLTADLPPNAVAIVQSPSDPLGSLLAPADLVRLARSCCLVLIDERFAEISGQSLVPMAIEFDNVIVFRSLAYWAGLENQPLAFAIGSRRALEQTSIQGSSICASAVATAARVLEDLSEIEQNVRAIRSERSRLYRLVRKFAFLEPVPGWGPFLAVRVGLGQRDHLVGELRQRDVHIAALAEPGLESYVRIGIGTRHEMDRLATALRDVAPTIIG